MRLAAFLPIVLLCFPFYGVTSDIEIAPAHGTGAEIETRDQLRRSPTT
jgi:hypothetical protein